MTNLPLLLYFADILDGLKILLTVLIAISIIGIILPAIGKIMIFCDGNEQDKKKYFPFLDRFLKAFIISCVIVSTLQIFTPSKNTVYVYAGIQTATEVSSNPTLEKISKVVNKKLDEILKSKE